ncbi:hypothetical protein B5X24_HaOG204537 [Helicoverpa armigera]|uniref:Uncharacterized protein n=1 Tax=Helicoverpa armigera TaxID=29058 RepID=A0A2W1BUZ8_HELAM|nr:hypothetical protein B5X24_HaOG204537 [Helicoverpa armigera]
MRYRSRPINALSSGGIAREADCGALKHHSSVQCAVQTPNKPISVRRAEPRPAPHERRAGGHKHELSKINSCLSFTLDLQNKNCPHTTDAVTSPQQLDQFVTLCICVSVHKMRAVAVCAVDNFSPSHV